MRHLALAALAIALLAGCLQPSGSNTGTGATTPTVSTPPATDTTPDGGAGPGAGGPPTGGMLVRPAHNESTQDGFTLTGDESASGFIAPNASVTFTFDARNDGSAATYRGGCALDPQISIQDENGTTLRTDTQAHCMAIMMVDMPSGAHAVQNLTWNGTYYDPQGQLRTVAPGTYTAVATFRAQRDGADITLTVSVPVNVLDDSQRGVL